MKDAVTFIKRNIKRDPTEKITITLPKSIIEQTDTAAKSAGCSRSEVIKIALVRLIQEEVAQTA